MAPVHVESGISSVKVGVKYELAPDHVESATSSVRVGAEYKNRRTLVSLAPDHVESGKYSKFSTNFTKSK